MFTGGSRHMNVGVASSLLLMPCAEAGEPAWVEVGAGQAWTKQVELAKRLAARAGLTYVGDVGDCRVAWRRVKDAPAPH